MGPCRYTLRWGWVFLKRKWNLSGIQFTTHFIELFVVETKRFVCSIVNVSWRGKPAASARARLRKANAERWEISLSSEFSICSQNIEETETWVCAQLRDFRLNNRSAMAKSNFSCVETSLFFQKSPLRCGSPNASPEVVHRPRSQSPLHFDIRNM